MHISIPPGSSKPVPRQLKEAVERLRAEVEHHADPSQLCSLHHELGRLEEAAENDHQASQDLLAAINAYPKALEPLERLLSLLQRRGSRKNIPRLLERMLRLSSEQARQRGRIALAEFAADAEANDEQAALAWGKVQTEQPNDPYVWLASQLSEPIDASKHEEPLRRRAALAQTSAYGGTLLLLLADLQRSNGRLEESEQTLRDLAMTECGLELECWTRLEALARHRHDAQLVREALVNLALLPSDAHGKQQIAARAWVWATQTPDLAGAPAPPTHLLNDATDLALLWAFSRDRQTSSWTAPSPKLTALVASRELLLRHGQDDDRQSASTEEAAWQRVSVDEPYGIVPRAARLDACRRLGEPNRLARAKLDVANYLCPDPSVDAPGDRSAAAALLLESAYLYCLDGRKGELQEALQAARRLGVPAATVARLSRTFASTMRDSDWVLDSGHVLVRHTHGDERTSLTLEQLRLSHLRRDQRQATFAEAELREVLTSAGQRAVSEGRWLLTLLAAFGDGVELADTARFDAFSDLVALCSNDSRRWPLAHLMALASPDSAVSRLDALLPDQATYPEGALSLAGRLRGTTPGRSAELLQSIAETTASEELKAGLLLAAALLRWRSDAKEHAIQTLKDTAALDPTASRPLLAWALRSTARDSLDTLKEVWELEVAGAPEPAELLLNRLQRFAAAAAVTSDVAATDLLDQALDDSITATGTDVSSLENAILLASAMWPLARQHQRARRWLADSVIGRQFSVVLDLLDEHDKPHPSLNKLTALSRLWALEDSSAGALEWTAACIATADSSEFEARQALASHLTGRARAALLAGASYVALLHGRSPAMVSGNEPATRLANQELSTPGSDPLRRAAGLEAVTDELETDDAELARICAGYNRLLAFDGPGAFSLFHAVTERSPTSIPGWEGIRSASEMIGDKTRQAEACGTLATLVSSETRAAAFLREQAQLLADLKSPDPALEALSRAVSLDPKHTASFRQLAATLQRTGQHSRVLEMSARRAKVLDEEQQIAALTWDRARSHRALGQLDAALSALDELKILDPHRAGAYVLAGEIYMGRGQIAEAADQLRALAMLNNAPRQQRLLSGIAAADLLEGELKDLDQATQVLAHLHQAGLGGRPLLERLARTAAKAGQWQRAVSLFEVLMRAGDRSRREQAARIALVIFRDQLGEPTRAEDACRVLLETTPGDGETIDFLLTRPFDEDACRQLLLRAAAQLRHRLANSPEPEGVARLARIAQFLEDTVLRIVALGILSTAELTHDDSEAELKDFAASNPLLVPIKWAPNVLESLLAGRVSQPLAAVAELITPALQRLWEADLPELELVDNGAETEEQQHLAREVRAVAEAASLHIAEVRWSGNSTEPVLTRVGSSGLILILRRSEPTPLPTTTRTALVQEVFGQTTGTAIVRYHAPRRVALALRAALRLAEVPESEDASTEENLLRDELAAALTGKEKRRLLELALSARTVGTTCEDWVQEARYALDRAAALVMVDVGRILPRAGEHAKRRRSDAALASARARELLRFVLSTDLPALRTQLEASR